tara:strand:- start:875 stop:1357 length:483 start_codon:yes stop_codon:yes gene_type:complete
MALKFGKLKGIINAVAPSLGSAMGGPLGGIAAKAISSVLGVNPEPKAMEKALQNATPEQLAEIKKAELEFQKQMKELEVDVFKLENEDVQSARSAFAGDWTPKVFAMTIVLGFFAFVFYIVSDDWNREMEPLLNIILGGLLANVASVSSFYFGNSHKGEE